MSRVNIDTKVSPVPHQVRIAYMMLDDASAKNQHPSFRSIHRLVVDRPDVRRNVQYEASLLTITVEVDHVPYAAIGERRAIDWYVVLSFESWAYVNGTRERQIGPKGNSGTHLVGPVVDRLWVVYLLA